VLVAAYLSSTSLSYLRRVLGDDHDLTAAGRWEELVELVLRRPVDVVVVDPRTGEGDGLERVFELIERFPTVPVVAYTALTPEALRSVVELAKRGVRHVVLRGFDDEPRRLRELLEALPARRLGRAALDSIADELSGASSMVRRAFTRLYDSPHLFHSVESLARHAGVTRRTLDRWLAKQGLASARMMLFTARLAQAYHYLGEEGFLVEDVTRKLGYSSPRVFARQVRAAMGLNPSGLRARYAPEPFMSELTALMRRRGASNDGGIP
jgi:AraC-like DNA-binding protein